MSRRIALLLVGGTSEFERELGRARRSLRRSRRRGYMRDRLIGFLFGVFTASVAVLAGWLIASYA